MTNYLCRVRNIQLQLWLGVTLSLVWGELRPFAPGVTRTRDHWWPVTSVTHGAWRVTGHWSSHHTSRLRTNISNNHTLHYNNNITSQEISKPLIKLIYCNNISPVFHCHWSQLLRGKKILCEFVTEIRHTVIVTKSVISHGSVIRGTLPRHKHCPVTPNLVPDIII